jgi:small-conductance mechanosensitive channel
MDNARDIVIIIWGIMSILTLLVALLIALFIGLSVKNLVTTVNDLVNTSIKPVIDSTQQSVTNVTGTTQFVGDTLVSPIIRVISTLAGIKRFLGVFTGISSRLRGSGGGKAAR